MSSPGQPYLLYFHTISEQRWQGLDACRQEEYEPLEALTLAQKQAWHDALVLEQPTKGGASSLKLIGRAWMICWPIPPLWRSWWRSI